MKGVGGPPPFSGLPSGVESEVGSPPLSIKVKPGKLPDRIL